MVQDGGATRSRQAHNPQCGKLLGVLSTFFLHNALSRYRLESPRNVYSCPFIDAGLDALKNWSIDTQVMFQPTRQHARKAFLGLLERYHGLKENDIVQLRLHSKAS